jgi:hypothetical protein
VESVVSGWTITYVDGTEERTPEGADSLAVVREGLLLLAKATRTYGPDEVLATYNMTNVRKWVRDR